MTFLITCWSSNPTDLVIWANTNIGKAPDAAHPLWKITKILSFQLMVSAEEGYDLFVLYEAQFVGIGELKPKQTVEIYVVDD